MPQARLPRHSLHKATGQARGCIDGRDRSLGPHASPESRAEDRRLADRWQPRRRGRSAPSVTADGPVLLDGHFAARNFVKNGEPTSEPRLVKPALRPLVRKSARTAVADSGPRDLKAVRADSVADVSPSRP